MKNKTDSPTPATELRRQAEGIARGKAAQPTANLSPGQVQRAFHELQVHQIELEIQNDELRRVQTDLETSRARYFDLYDLAPVGYLSLSEQGMIQEANIAAANLLGVSRRTLIMQPFSRFILPEDQDIFYRHRKLLFATATPQVFDLRLDKNDAAPFPAQLMMAVAVTVDADGTPMCLTVVSDITERKNNEERLSQAAAVFENTREGVMITDAGQTVLRVNRAFTAITGYTETEVLGKKSSLLSSGHHDPGFYADLWAVVDATGHWQGEIWNRRKDGEIYPQLLSISAVRDATGLVTDYVSVFTDITQIKASEDRLDFLAHHDALTGLPNRLLLFYRLEHDISVARREGLKLALLLLDLDRFKDVNDGHGHLAGDELLQQVAERLSVRLRDADTVSRLGGDEFALILADLTHCQDAAKVAGEIIDAFNEPWRLHNGAEVSIGASIGISLFPENGQNPEELLQQADVAMYQAKNEGRGKFKYFSEDMTQAARARIGLETRLRRAMASDKLCVHYQPQIDMASGRMVGAEALVRWQDPDEGLIPPGRFIPLAEQTGLIVAIGKWVLREVCRQGRQWLDAGLPPLNLAVNLSPHQLRHSDMGATLAQILDETGFPPERLELELTESALMERGLESARILDELRALGVRMALDDFGTGYSSLAYLKRFPLDVLKIDKSFIDDIPFHQDDMDIASAIIAMGHILRLKVTAEGVETVEQFEFLQAQGCDSYQGYFNSHPMPAEAFAALLQRGSLAGSAGAGHG